MSAVEWTDAEREAAGRAAHEHDANASMSGVEWPTWDDLSDDGRAAYAPLSDDVLAALAPHVAAREAQARVDALREAAKEWQWGGWSDDLPPKGHSRPQLILGMAQKATSWLRAEADRIERGES